MPWYSFKEISARFDDVVLINTPAMDKIVERLAALQRYGFSVRQRRVLSAIYGRIINRRLAEIKPDIVLSIGASHKLIRIDPKWRLLHVSDGLFMTMVNYYEKFGRFRQAVLRTGHNDLQQFMRKVDLTLFASQWAHDSALTHYDLDPARARVDLFGANLDVDPGFRERQLDGPLTILFVGYDWERKGGDLVLATWRLLREATGDAELHIVGCKPPVAANIDGVTVHGRLRKSDPRDYAKLTHLYDRASMFFMPSRAEAFGMVFCEAAAYGIPSVAAITGGVPSVVIDNETGLLLDLGADARAYADRILDLWSDKVRFRAMSLAARRRFETHLNWNAWGEGVERGINDILSGVISPR